jgi:hypothetical protein
MAKGYLRESAASGTDRAKCERLIRRGWRPGLTYGEVLGRRPKQRPYVKGGQDCVR